MNQLSDSESRSSDEGIRYKTESTRYRINKKDRKSRSRSRSPNIFNKNKHDASNLEIYGPKLPTTFSSNNKDKETIIGPALSSKSNNGKTLDESENKKHKIGETASYGPALPPSLLNEGNDTNTQPKILGPALPPNFKPNNSQSQKIEKRYGLQLPSTMINIETESYGPTLPSTAINTENERELEEELEETYGPLPPGMASTSKGHIALEERALQMKIDKLNPNQDDQIVREEWMTELPEISKKFGLGPRQFRPNPAPDLSDRSSWTDTPEDKIKKTSGEVKKVDVKKEAEIKELKRYDEEQEKMAKKHKKHKKEKSLVEMHQDKLNKKKKDEGPSVRRPFSRETDLKVNRFDEAQKKAILKKAQLLDDRFSRGQSKFL